MLEWAPEWRQQPQIGTSVFRGKPILTSCRWEGGSVFLFSSPWWKDPWHLSGIALKSLSIGCPSWKLGGFDFLLRTDVEVIKISMKSKKRVKGIGTLIAVLAPGWKGFKSLDGPHLVYSFFVLVIAHSWGQEMRLTFWPETTKTRIETLGDLNEPIRVTINFSLLPRYREIDGTRYAVPSRSSGFPVMWSLVLLSRILCLRYHD